MLFTCLCKEYRKREQWYRNIEHYCHREIEVCVVCVWCVCAWMVTVSLCVVGDVIISLTLLQRRRCEEELLSRLLVQYLLPSQTLVLYNLCRRRIREEVSMGEHGRRGGEGGGRERG